MMQGSFDDDDDPVAEGIAIAIAYREANDMDTMQALNEQSNCRKDKPPGLKYYLVPADWMRLVWRVVLQHTTHKKAATAATATAAGKNLISYHTNGNKKNNNTTTEDTITIAIDWRDQVGPIPTQQLLEPTTTTSNNNKTNGTNVRKGSYAQALASATTKSTAAATVSTSTKTTTAAISSSTTLRPGLQHEVDYYLLGSNTWLLLHGKFGTLGPTLVRKVCFHPTKDSSIAVVVKMLLNDTSSSTSNNNNNSSTMPPDNGNNNNNNKGMLIPIPGTGRFPYEASLQQHSAAAAASTSDDVVPKQHYHPPQHPVAAAAAAVAAKQHQQQQQRQHVGNVSDDETDDAVYPAMVDDDIDHMSTSDNPPISETTLTSTLSATNHSSLSSPQPILLLPPSTTSYNNKTNDYWNDNSSNNNHDDIELEISTSDNINIISQNYNHQTTSRGSTSSYFKDIEADDDPADTSSVIMGSSGRGAAATTCTHTSILRYGSGLGNLGNTCFMNSTLQCLAHTHALQSYFLSGDYQQDLNKDNPLGTGGELALSFAQLLAEMWWEKTTINNMASAAIGTNTRSWSYSTSHVIYPRSFKYTVGKHAEQFMGYDQHDSQEFATYLLDALHEDTNRVLSVKPYVEKPEQAEGESDETAADKAWELHLKREDSRVLDHFMGQVKSRVQCCEEGCGRVSTTFDPFMFLSVPIPGSSERAVNITYVPLDPNMRAQALSVTLAKMGTIADLLKQMCSDLLKYAIVQSEADLPALEDLFVVDIWNRDIFHTYNHADELDKIKDNDDTWVYALQPLQDLRKLAATDGTDANDADNKNSIAKVGAGFAKRYTVDVGTLTSLNRKGWSNSLGKYLKNEVGFLNTFNKTKGKHEDRIIFYQRLTSFIDLCHKELVEDGGGQKRAHEETSSSDSPSATAASHILTMPNEPLVPDLCDRCDASPTFKNVETRHDVAILEFCAGKMRGEIFQMEQDEKNKFLNGVVLCVRSRKPGTFSRDTIVARLVVLRVASDMTVYGLRQELARRFSRALQKGRNGHGSNSNNSSSGPSSLSGGQATSEATSEAIPMEDDDNNHIPTGGATSETPPSSMNGFHHDTDNTFGSPELMIFRQIPLSYDRGKNNKSSSGLSSTLGSLHKPSSHHGGMSDDDNHGGRRPMSLASPTDEHESENIAQVVGDQGTVSLEWTDDLIDTAFDTEEFDAVDNVNRHNSNDASRAGKCITVQDCIAKYCQKEQLEETEMWYCNKCKKHVRAWKQFHLFRTPPVLIVHLKRFQFTASTHRRDKIGRFIDFPLEGLDLADHVLHYTDEEKPIYDCYAVSNHYGGLGGGHYTAHCLSDDGVWCYYDDSRISVNVDPKEVISDAAYVLYYRRRDVVADTNQDFLLNIHTPPDDDQQAQVVVGPAIIMDTNAVGERGMGEPSDMSSTNAAIIGEDDNTMEVDVGSRSTSPMGSMDGVDDFASFRPLQQQHNYGDDDDTEDLPDAVDRLPRQ